MIGPTPLSDAERTSTRKTLYLLFNDSSTLVDSLTKTFQSLAFENRFSLHPRRLKELAIELVVSLDAFLLSNDPTLTHEIGKQHAFEGMGEKLVLLVSRGINQFFFDTVKPRDVETFRLFNKVVDNYVTNYLLGYMLAREEYTLREQELLRKAVLEVSKQKAALESSKQDSTANVSDAQTDSELSEPEVESEVADADNEEEL